MIIETFWKYEAPHEISALELIPNNIEKWVMTWLILNNQCLKRQLVDG